MIQVHRDAESLARAAAELIADEAVRAVEESGRFALALAGGTTPRRAYELLAAEPLRSRVPWSSVHVYWGDERCVSPDDERSNERMARRALLDRVPIDERNVHPMRCDGDPVVAAAEYETLLQAEFGVGKSPLDLVLLGMGEDGHTAGLFPGSPALDETLRWTAVVEKAGEPHRRITTTLPLINLASTIVVLVSGASKSSMLKTILETDSELPAARLSDGSLWMVDEAALGIG